jgi:hypothetical protein
MCWLSRQTNKTVEEIVAQNSVGMSDKQKAQYWYELNQSIFALLGKVDVPVFELAPADWQNLAQFNYPTLTDIKIADSQFFTTSLQGLQEILSRDWTNLVPYVAEVGDCDKFATRLYSHLCDFYKLNAIVPVWGDTDQGYHGFNLAVVKDVDKFITRLIEPQTDLIFVDQGPLGKYVPRSVVEELGIKKIRSN